MNTRDLQIGDLIWITPEILLNNGFRLADGFTDVYEHKTSPMIRIIKTYDEKWSVSTTNVTDITIKYVHQLQQTLRVCGLT